jgi:negative regulator of flagellin synthesis FlgM
MSIDIRDLNGHRQLPGHRGVSGQTAPADHGPRSSGDARSSAGTDKVDLSQAARHLKALEQAAQTGGEFDAGKVESIRQQIAEGQYHVDAGKLAGHMIDLERELLG